MNHLGHARSIACLSIVVLASPVWADYVDPPYAATRCLAEHKNPSPQKLRACCDEELDGGAKEVAACVRIATEQMKSGPAAEVKPSPAKPSAKVAPNAANTAVEGEKELVAVSTPPPTAALAREREPAPVNATARRQGNDLVQGVRGLLGR